MNQKTYFGVSGTMFLIVAAAHATRLITKWDISIAGWVVPHWLSVPGLIVSGFLAVWGFMLASRTKPTAG